MAGSYNGWTNYETWRIKLEIDDEDLITAHLLDWQRRR